MLNLFYTPITAIDLGTDKITMLRGKKLFKKALISEIKTFPTSDELTLDTYEDEVIVTNVNMDLVIFITFSIPAKAKRKEIEKIGKMEASRNFDLPPEEIFVSLVEKVEDKGVMAVSRKDSIRKSVIERLQKIGVGEPDVVIPDAFKFFYLYNLSKPGKIIAMIANFRENYVFNALMFNGHILSVRTFSIELSRIFSYVKNEFGIDLKQLEHPESLSNEVEEAIKFEFVDLSLEMMREFTLLLNNSIVPTKPDEIEGLFVITDPGVLFGPLFKSFKEVNVEFPLIEPPVKNFVKILRRDMVQIKGAIGLFVRGVEEYGKIKSLSIEKAEDKHIVSDVNISANASSSNINENNPGKSLEGKGPDDKS